MPKSETQPMTVQYEKPSCEYTFTYPSFKPSISRLHFSNKEIKHLAIAALLVTGVGLSFVGFPDFIRTDYFTLMLFITMFTASFLAHEVAHKVVAQKAGLWAEFRLTLMGGLLTLFSVVSPIFKIIAPGAVMISGSADRRIMGKTSIAGPATNIMLGTIFLTNAFIFNQYNNILAPIAAFNIWIALFNLIPFAVLDGLKVFTWNKRIWTLIFTASVVLAIVSYRQVYM